MNHSKIVFSAAFIVSMLACVCSAQVRQPSVVGKFYPDKKEELSAMINNFLDAVPADSILREDKSGKIAGIIVPHAGYVFSGSVAAYAFKQLMGKTYDVVVLIGQSHNYPLNKTVLSNDTDFITPLGSIPVELRVVKALTADQDGLFEIDSRAHRPEHSLEVELPFLQTVLSGKFKILPVLVGNFTIETCKKTAKKLVLTIKRIAPGKRVLFVISSDMSHYPEYQDAYKSDKKAIEVFEKFDPQLLKKTINHLMASGIPSLECVFCGEEAVYTGMYAAKMLGANKIESLKYANSGDVPNYGVKNRVVGYYAAAFVEAAGRQGLKNNSEGKQSMKNEFSVSEKNQKVLIELARSTVSEYFNTQKIKPFKTTNKELLAPAAVFVTLTENGQLRGCIGTTSPQAPLYQAVQQMAIAAAFEDHRFSKLTQNELKNVRMEISVLSPLVKIKSADEIKENIHGVTVRRGGQGGIFLPQVWEHFDKKEDFLNELCTQKAGLPAKAWREPDTELCVFTVFAFEEK